MTTVRVHSTEEVVISASIISNLLECYTRYILAQTNFNTYKLQRYVMTGETRKIFRKIWYKIHYDVIAEMDIPNLNYEESIKCDDELITRLTILSDTVKMMADAAKQIQQNPTTYAMQQGILSFPANINGRNFNTRDRFMFTEAYNFGSTECQIEYYQMINQQFPPHLVSAYREARRNTQRSVLQFQHFHNLHARDTYIRNYGDEDSQSNTNSPISPINLHQNDFENMAALPPPKPPILVTYDNQTHRPVTHDDCAICYTKYKKFTKVTLNCNHAFCITCVNQYTTSTEKDATLKCPMCRAEIMEMKTHTKKNVSEITGNINARNL